MGLLFSLAEEEVHTAKLATGNLIFVKSTDKTRCRNSNIQGRVAKYHEITLKTQMGGQSQIKLTFKNMTVWRYSYTCTVLTSSLNKLLDSITLSITHYDMTVQQKHLNLSERFVLLQSSWQLRQ